MNNEIKITCTSKEDTDSLAKIVSGSIYTGLVIALIGDLGAGKTTFIQDLVKHSGNNELVTSPTFTLLNIYPGKTKFYHFDLYRLSSLLDIENIGGEELIPSKDGITLIEWADRIPEIMPENYLKISIDYVDENTRLFTFNSTGKTIEIERIKQQWQF